jgi:DNA-directed RNA polymerase subunit RPC12/RpoP
MSLYHCDRCNRIITQGIFSYSMNHFNRPLCMTCQNKIRRAEEIKNGTYQPEEEYYEKCVRCGKVFSEPQKNDPYCGKCRKEIKSLKVRNPFSRTSSHVSKVMRSSGINRD